MHDLGLARAFGNKSVLLDNGIVVAAGDIKDVLSEKSLNQVYGMNVREYYNKLYQNW